MSISIEDILLLLAIRYSRANMIYALIKAVIKRLDKLICFKIISDELIDSVMGTMDHVHCENISHLIHNRTQFQKL